MRTLIRRLRSEQSGLSLTELLVSSMLTLLVLLMVGNMFISVTKITSASNQTRMSNDVATNVVNEVTSVARVSTDLLKADDSTDFAVQDGSNRSKLIVFSLSNTSPSSPAPSKFTFEVVTTTQPGNPIAVKETKCPGTPSGTTWTFASGTGCTARILGTGVVTPGSVTDPLFTYRDSLGVAMVIDSTDTLSASQRDQVASITVTVRALAPGSKTSTVTVTNTVVLRNLGLDSST